MAGPRPPYPFPAVTDTIVQILIKGFMAAGGSTSKRAYNVFHYRLTGPAGAPSKASINTVFQANVVAPLLAATNVRYTPSVLTIRFVSNASDPAQQFSVAGTGAIATDSQPSDDAVVVNLQLFRS